MGRKFFLLYLKPIINGIGNYYIEAQTRDARRTDVIVDYLGEQFVIEGGLEALFPPFCQPSPGPLVRFISPGYVFIIAAAEPFRLAPAKCRGPTTLLLIPGILGKYKWKWTC